MEKELTIPKISEDADEATIGEILVSEGDSIEKDQSIMAVESDKASVEIPAEFSGKITGIKVSKGDTVKVGDAVMTVETEDTGSGEEKSEEEKSKKESEKDAAEEKEKKADSGSSDDESKDEKKEEKTSEKSATKNSEDSKQESEKDTKESKSSSNADQEVAVAPLARKLARELGVELSEVPKSGERLTSEDVTNYVKKLVSSKKPGRESSAPSLPDFSKWGETEREKLSGIRKATAKNTTESWQHIPHVTQNDKANVSGLEEFLEKQNEKSEEKITITAVLLKLIGEALVEFPDFNASLDMQQEEVIYKKYHHIGVAVDTDNGLLVPVIRDVPKKSISQLAGELNEAAQKARDDKLTSDEMKGGNFTISNLGGIGGTSFTPVIFPPQVAILGVSRTETEAVYKDGKFGPERMLPLSLSYDHRMIDGAKAARFLRWVCESLEQPLKLMMH
ncbi:2-oxo acid dehydrogenase subunit E2 [Halocola ammonii]